MREFAQYYVKTSEASRMSPRLPSRASVLVSILPEVGGRWQDNIIVREDVDGIMGSESPHPTYRICTSRPRSQETMALGRWEIFRAL